jgi:hypothetical protein
MRTFARLRILAGVLAVPLILSAQAPPSPTASQDGDRFWDYLLL